MKSKLTSKLFHKPDAVRVLLLAVLVVTGTVDFTRGVSVGGITALGAFTLFGCGAAWAFWLAKPYLPTDLLKPLLPLLLFELYAVGSMTWYSPGTKGLQLLAVGLAFLAIILVTARETDHDPEFADTLHKALLYSSVPAVLLYFYAVEDGGLAADGLVNARPFALYAMVALAVAIARWRAGAGNGYLAWGGVIVLAVFLSLSRTALVACLLLFPIGIALRLNKKSLVLAVIILAIATAGFITAVLTYQPLYDRFFGFYRADVGGMAMNVSGRTKMWNMLFETLGDDWVFGKGIAASGNLIDEYFPDIGHPHNDFLRYYYDLGVVGLSMWLLFVFAFTWKTMKNLGRSVRDFGADYPLHLAALMALIAVSGSMFTDNSVSYFFVMMPLAIVIGCSLGAGRAAGRRAVPIMPVIAEPAPEIYPPVGAPRRARWGSRNLPTLIDS
jgi:O-antigen ligase